MQRIIPLLLVSTLLLTACFSWWRSAPSIEERTVSLPQAGEAEIPPIPEITPDAVEVPEVPAPAPQPAGSPVGQQWQPKMLTKKEEKLLLNVDEWMAKARGISISIGKLYAASKGAPIQDLEDINLQKQYEDFHTATGRLGIPPEYARAKEAVEKYEQRVGEVIASLSSSPSSFELGQARNALDTLLPEWNTVTQLLHEVQQE